jgi:GDP-4-dehydro-6-deoxy-D-mannose reductase
LAPQRILVTGASGFVAGHLLPALRVAFPQAELVLLGGASGMTPLDITHHVAVDALIADVQPDACIHLAAVSTVSEARSNQALAWQVNLHGTLALAGGVLRHAPSCWFLFISSADIYGASFAAGEPLDEAALPAPLNTYAASKAAADLALGAMAAEGLRTVRMRPFNHTGAGQSAAFVVPAFARQVARIAAGRQAPKLQVGALDPQRDFLDVRDVCAAYVACLQRADRMMPGAVFNIASGTPRRVGDVLATLLKLAGVTAEIETGAALLRPTDIAVASGNAAAAREALAWSPAIAWDQTLREVLDDWKLRVATGKD